MFEPPPPSAARLWSFVPTAPGHSLYCVPKNRPHCAPGRAGPPLAITGHVFTTINLLTREKGSHRTGARPCGAGGPRPRSRTASTTTRSQGSQGGSHTLRHGYLRGCLVTAGPADSSGGGAPTRSGASFICPPFSHSCFPCCPLSSLYSRLRAGLRGCWYVWGHFWLHAGTLQNLKSQQCRG